MARLRAEEAARQEQVVQSLAVEAQEVEARLRVTQQHIGALEHARQQREAGVRQLQADLAGQHAAAVLLALLRARRERAKMQAGLAAIQAALRATRGEARSGPHARRSPVPPYAPVPRPPHVLVPLSPSVPTPYALPRYPPAYPPSQPSRSSRPASATYSAARSPLARGHAASASPDHRGFDHRGRGFRLASPPAVRATPPGRPAQARPRVPAVSSPAAGGMRRGRREAQAAEAAALLPRIVVDHSLPRTQEGYAEAAGIAHREHKANAKGLVLGLRRVAAAGLQLQAAGRGAISRRAMRRRREEEAREAAWRRGAAERERQQAARTIGAGMRGRAARRGVREQKRRLWGAAVIVLEALRVGHSRRQSSVGVELARTRARGVLRVQAAIKNRKLYAGWNSWVAMAYARREALDRMRRSLSWLVNRKLATCWNQWLAVAAARSEGMDQVQRSLSLLVNRKLYAGWNSWVAMAAARREALDRMRRSLSNLANGKLTRGFQSWLGAWRLWREERRRAKAATSLASGVRGFQGRQVAAQIRWHGRENEAATLLASAARGRDGRKAAAQKRSMSRALRHLVHRELSRGWVGWHARWREAVRRRELDSMSRALRYLVNRRLSAGWQSWVAMATWRREALDRMRRGLSSLIHRKLLLGWNSWVEMAARRWAVRHQQDAAAAAIAARVRGRGARREAATRRTARAEVAAEAAARERRMREERSHGADMLLVVLRARREHATMTAGLASLHAVLAPLQAAMRGRRARRERKEAARAATTVASGYRGRRARLTASGWPRTSHASQQRSAWAATSRSSSATPSASTTSCSAANAAPSPRLRLAPT